MVLNTQPSGRSRASLASAAEGLARREGLFPRESRALVMVSGGQDSLALLHLLCTHALGTAGPAEVRVLHVNHHLRGAESEADQALVENTCERLGVQLTVSHQPVEKGQGNVQEVAREGRRAAALETAAKAECERIAVGHTADDQVETLLYRMGRYGGLAALAGMRPCDAPWVRPLLDCRREETAAYCVEHGLTFAHDRGNAYPGYARTGIRERVMSAWEEVLPGAVWAACRVAEVAAEMRELTGTLVGEAAVRAGLKEPWSEIPEGGGWLTVAGLLSLSPPVRRLFLHEYLQSHFDPAATRASVLAVEELLAVQGSGRRSLGGGWQAVKEYDRLVIEPVGGEDPVMHGPTELAVPGQAFWGQVVVTAEQVAEFRAPDVSREAFIDGDSLEGAVSVRGPEPGDRVRPLGAPGTRKLQDILVDLRVPRRERAEQALVVCDERIVWVCGHVVSEHARVSKETKRITRLSIAAAVDGGRS